MTYKARIIAEAKLRKYSLILSSMIIWYSFLMIVASLAITNDTITMLFYEIIFASASIAIFAASIFLATGVLEKRASEFRACYLELQKIYGAQSSDDAKMKRYYAALDRYPNHASRDHADLIFSTWQKDGELFDARGKIPLSWQILCMAVVRKTVFWLTVIMMFVAPIWIAPAVLVFT